MDDLALQQRIQNAAGAAQVFERSASTCVDPSSIPIEAIMEMDLSLSGAESWLKVEPANNTANVSNRDDVLDYILPTTAGSDTATADSLESSTTTLKIATMRTPEKQNIPGTFTLQTNQSFWDNHPPPPAYSAFQYGSTPPGIDLENVADLDQVHIGYDGEIMPLESAMESMSSFSSGTCANLQSIAALLKQSAKISGHSRVRRRCPSVDGRGFMLPQLTPPQPILMSPSLNHIPSLNLNVLDEPHHPRLSIRRSSASSQVGSPVTPGSSCHQCKSRRTSNELSICSNSNEEVLSKGKRMSCCRKQFCENCLLKFYSEKPPSKNHDELKCWPCPSCRGICSCAACRRQKLKKSLAGNNNKHKKQLSMHKSASCASSPSPSSSNRRNSIATSSLPGLISGPSWCSFPYQDLPL